MLVEHRALFWCADPCCGAAEQLVTFCLVSRCVEAPFSEFSFYMLLLKEIALHLFFFYTFLLKFACKCALWTPRPTARSTEAWWRCVFWSLESTYSTRWTPRPLTRSTEASWRSAAAMSFFVCSVFGVLSRSVTAWRSMYHLGTAILAENSWQLSSV